MGFIKAIQLFTIFIGSRVLSVYKAEEVSWHRSYPVWLSMQADLQDWPVRTGSSIPCNFTIWTGTVGRCAVNSGAPLWLRLSRYTETAPATPVQSPSPTPARGCGAESGRQLP